MKTSPPPDLADALDGIAMDLECQGAPTVLPGLPPERLARLLADPPLRRRLERLNKAMRKRQELSMGIAAVNAVDRLMLSLENDEAMGTSQTRTCVLLVKLDTQARAQALRERTAKNSKNTPAENFLAVRRRRASPAPDAHPDVPPDEAEALRRRLDEEAT
jgi:hypothetical protein